MTPQANPIILSLESPDATLELVGGKGASLARLAAAHLPTPPGFHITTRAYHRFVNENHLAGAILAFAAQARSDDPASLDGASTQIQSLMAQGAMPGDIAASIRQWVDGLGAGDPAVAVRSSATAEDLPGMSFAGQQDTYLNVHGGGNVLDAVKRCWASLWTARAMGYRARQGIRSEDIGIAVVVQELVAADVAGILFTANPLTGARDQMTIDAAFGLGEAIVGGHVTPDSFTVDKRTGAILSQQIADKEVMTVRLAEGTREEPVPADQRRQAAIEAPQVAELARLGARIERLYGQPMDIEWAMRDGKIFILQARPITSLPEARPALDWKLPRAKGSYWRSSVIELLPEPLSPLFATLGLPMWNEASRDLFQSLGSGDLCPEQLLLTINDYAYYDFNFRFSVSKVARWLLAVPRLMRRGFALIRRARTRWEDEARPRYAAVVAEWAARDPMAIPAAQLLAAAREIAKAAAEHYLVVQSGVLPAAYVSETLFTSAYTLLAKRKGDPPALTFVLGFDSAPIQSEKSLYDLAMWARTQPALAEYLTQTSSQEIVAACQTAGAPTADAEGWREFTRGLAEHLNRFGHSIYDLDFAKSLAADDPAPLLEALKYFLSGQARNPHDRQAEGAVARERATEALLGRLKGIRLRFFRWILPMAQRFAPLRENALADVGLGWPLLRRMLRELGRRLAAAGAIATCDDVFWLKLDEADEAARALDAAQPPQDYRSAVAGRRATGERERAVTPPVVLPVKGGGRFLGIDFTRWMPARTSQAAGDTIKGIGASPGRVAGVARVIHGPDEFKQMRHGDILVAKITTPAWTPLFALASGVVTDVGGPLSHGSIVAREYRIPAVLGTGVATERIRSGQRIAVDGDGGVVTVGG